MTTDHQKDVGAPLVGALAKDDDNRAGTRPAPTSEAHDSRPWHRRSIRHAHHDYTSAGAYFITICTQGRLCLFGDVVDRCMTLNAAGTMIAEQWLALGGRFSGLRTDAFVVMPNHFHGILVVSAPRPDADSTTPLPHAPALGDIVGAFKSLTTNAYGHGVRSAQWPAFKDRLWQRNYFERVVRDEEELNRIREYIRENPRQWANDRENPSRPPEHHEPLSEPWET